MGCALRLRVPPPPRAAPGVGRAAPRPPWAAPPVASRPRAPAVCRPGGRGKRSAQAEGRRGSGHGCDGGGGGQPLAVVHARRLAPPPSPLDSVFQKVGRAYARRGVPGGVPPGVVERWARPGGRWAVRGQRAALSPPSTGRQALSTAERATGRSLRGCLARAAALATAYYVQSEKQRPANPHGS